jgi:hypothetical protein
LALTERLSSFDKQQLLNLRSNARRLQSDTGPRADEARALLPLVEAEIASRSPAAPAKARAKKA